MFNFRIKFPPLTLMKKHAIMNCSFKEEKMDFGKIFDDMLKFVGVRMVVGGAVLVAAITALVTLVCHVAGWAEIPLWTMAIGAAVGAMAGILMVAMMLPGIFILGLVVAILISTLHQ